MNSICISDQCPGPCRYRLLSTLKVSTNLARLICYQGLLGFGIGAGIQGPQVAAQTVLKPTEVSIGLAVVIFAQGMGPAIFLSAASTIFNNRLGAEVAQYVPGTNATSLANMGLSDIKGQIGGDRLEQVLTGYDHAVIQTLYLPVALAV